MSKKQVFVVKGSSPWYRFDWWDIVKITNIDKSVSGQVTVTCNGSVTTMASLFSGCCNLTSIDLSSFDTSKVTEMGGMFYECERLTELDLSNFDTSNVTDMRDMFYGCSNLTTIKGVVDMKSCTEENYYFMFYKCPNLKDVKIKNPPADTDWWKKAGFRSESQFTVVS